MLRASLSGHDANDLQADRAWHIIKEKWGNASPETIQRFLSEKFSGDHLRKFEYAFLAQCLARGDVCHSMIVDMGGGNSYSTVVPMLFHFSETQILSIDPVSHTAVSRYGVHYVQGDCMHTNLEDQSADVVTIISTLEHVGLGRWGDPLNVNGDIQAMREAWRILRPNGHVVLTIPYGYPTVVFNLHRIYDAGRLRTLIEGFEPILERYSLHGLPSTRNQAEGKKATIHVPGFYQDVPDHLRHPDAQGGVLLLLKKGLT